MSVDWRTFFAKNPDLKIGSVVYLQWKEGVSKRVIIGFGHMQRRNFVVLFLVSPRAGVNTKDLSIICCAPGHVVIF